MSVKIYTDAGSNLFKEILAKRGVEIIVLPMTLTVNDKEYHCYSDDIDVASMSKDFYMEMRNGSHPKTSLPSPGLFEELAKKDVANGDRVLFVTLSSGISGTFQSASLIASQINEAEGKEAVAVLDSKTAGFGEGMIALKAASLSKEGLNLSEIKEQTEEYVKKVRSEFTVDSIKYLANSGRVSALTAKIADVLMIKPLLYGSDEGKIVVTAKVPGRKNALKHLVSQLLEHISDKNSLVYIAHCDAEMEAKNVEKELHENGVTNTEVYYYDLVTGAHVGPGTIALFYEGKDRSVEKKGVLSSLLPKKH